jgi:hypothetical protein
MPRGHGSIPGLLKILETRALSPYFKRLRSPGIDSEESTPPGYAVWRAGTTNGVAVPARQAGIDSWAP